MDFSLFKSGQEIDGKYIVEERIGRGAFGTVLRVKSKEDGHCYALKYCVGEDTDYERFKREMSLLDDLYLANVIRIVDSELNSSPPYYVMPLAEGSLEDRASFYRESEDNLLAVFIKVCNGVRGLHLHGCFHRDLKPENIIIVNGEPYVADFGIARLESRVTAGLTQTALGSLEYAAPEQFTAAGAKNADARSDIFSLGKLLYWLYTGRSPSHIDYELLPPKVKPIVRRSTMIEPGERFQSVDSLIDVLAYYRDARTAPTALPAPGKHEPAGFQKIAEAAVDAVQQRRPDASPLLRDLMDALRLNLTAIAPALEKAGEPDDLLVAAIDDSAPLVATFQAVVNQLSRMNANEEAITLFKAFSTILEGYNPEASFSGRLNDGLFDFFKFIGHELLVSYMALLIHHERWEAVADLVEERIYITNSRSDGGYLKDFRYAGDCVALLEYRNRRLNMRRLSVRADILNQRHTNSPLADLVPMALFTEADYFLYLRSAFTRSESDRSSLWWPWSALYSPRGSPRFMHEATRAKYALKLLRPLGVQDIATFRALFAERGRNFERMYGESLWSHPIAYVKPDGIGTE